MARGGEGKRFLSSAAVVLVALVAVSMVLGVRGGAEQSDALSMGLFPTRSACQGSIAECLGVNEFAVDSEASRRILATSGYISYQALKSNSVPCSRRGASYYNCQPGAQANPYSRGCSAISRCRSG